MQCPKCGFYPPEGVSNCPACGEFLPQPQKKKKADGKTVAIIVLACLTLIFIGLLAMSFNTAEEAEKVQKQYAEIENEYEFYHKNAVIVYTEDETYYHRHGCDEGSGSCYIYNKEAAESKGILPCPECCD